MTGLNDEEQFIDYMRKSKKPERTIQGYVNSLMFYVDFLHSHQQMLDPVDAELKDLKKFVKWGTEKGENVYRHLFAIRTYYEFKQLEIMELTAQEWMEYIQNETRKLREFPNADQASLKKLSAIGISTVNELLRDGDTPDKRRALSERSGAPEDSITELYKLANLSRLPGLKKVRGQIFYEAGLDTFSSIASLDPEKVCKILNDYVKDTGFNGSPPTLSEAEATIRMAKFLPESLRT